MNIIQILQESVHMIISVETNDDISYKGTVVEVDEYMNVFLKNVDVFKKDEGVYFKKEIIIRGSHIKYFMLPSILKYFKNDVNNLNKFISD